MVSARSYLNLFDPGDVETRDFDNAKCRLPQVISDSGIISDFDCKTVIEERQTVKERNILVANYLPLNCKREIETGKWCFTWDEDSLFLQMKDGFSPETEVIYVGSLNVDIDASEQEKVGQLLVEKYKCIPTFLSLDLQEKFYHGFCKQNLWPLLHYMLPISQDLGCRFDMTLYKAYLAANKIIADKVVQAMKSDGDYIWVHDYHLMLVPTFVRKRMYQARIGFFLHSPFPSSEIYRTLPVREEILMSLLNCDLIGFQTFAYARHFLSCCSRMLGLDYESKRGYIGLEYLGRIVSIKILPVGVHMGRLESVLSLSSTESKIQEIKEKYNGKKLVLGVDDMDIFKGISLKLMALELLLQRSADLCGEIILIQIANPRRTTGKDVAEARNEVISIAERINLAYGFPGYEPVVLITDTIPYHEKLAFYAAADCCIVNAIRDGMNLIPYEYVICRQGIDGPKKSNGNEMESRCSTLIVSEFVGCSPSLSGAIRVNPWNIEDVCEALRSAIHMTTSEKQLCHEKHYRYVSSHHVAYWVNSFIQDLKRSCKDHYNRWCWGIGFSTKFRVVALSPSFRRLSIDRVISSYKRNPRRAIFLDYDGTIKPQFSIDKAPAAEVISILRSLCSDHNNTVFIVSGRDQDSLGKWFSQCEELGIAAEHGYFLRWNKNSEWESDMNRTNLSWKEVAIAVMKSYTEATDGSYIESKRTAVVWHHCDADPDFGSCQAKELVNHLESVLANKPAVVTRGQQIVEVKPQGVGKGLVLEKLLSKLVARGKAPEFVMCIGDDRSDEDMFDSINQTVTTGSLFPALPEVFACTVGQKPSKAKYYVDDNNEVISLLKAISSCQKPKYSAFGFEMAFDRLTA